MQKPHFGGDGRRRRQQKNHLVLSWLADWKFSTMPILMTRLGLKKTTNRTYQKWLAQESGWLREIPQTHLRHSVYMLSRDGTHACDNPRAAYYNTDVSKIKHSTIPHNLAMQSVIANNMASTGIVHWQPDFMVGIDDKMDLPMPLDGVEAIKPDTLLTHQNGAIQAIEMELHYKSAKKIYYKYINYMELLAMGQLDRVTWFFENDAMRKLYREKFEADSWPWVIHRDHAYITTKRRYQPESHTSRMRFLLLHEDLPVSLR